MTIYASNATTSDGDGRFFFLSFFSINFSFLTAVRFYYHCAVAMLADYYYLLTPRSKADWYGGPDDGRTRRVIIY